MVATATAEATAPVAETLQEQFFTCVSCKLAKPYSFFSKSRSRKAGIQNRCKECYAQYQRAWSSKHRDKHNEVRNNWRRSNHEKWLAYVAEWRRRDPSRNTAYVAARNSARIKATPKWADLKAIQEIYRRCREISKATGIKHNVDHIIPLQGRDVCGLHVESNLQIITQEENFKKHLAYEREPQWRS